MKKHRVTELELLDNRNKHTKKTKTNKRQITIKKSITDINPYYPHLKNKIIKTTETKHKEKNTQKNNNNPQIATGSLRYPSKHDNSP